MRRIAVYPGSFDPITKGHTAILHSGLVAFEKIIVAVLNDDKQESTVQRGGTNGDDPGVRS